MLLMIITFTAEIMAVVKLLLSVEKGKTIDALTNGVMLLAMAIMSRIIF